ncbi:MAG TPA: lysophospholipase [Thermoguttaceae bacterium]|nr:lysophospholipase [Thermoguttaceae bacterium]
MSPDPNSPPSVPGDDPSIANRSWTPKTPSRALVIFVHGFTEHCGRYEHVAQALVARGVAVHALDLRGHGRSGGPRASIRSFAEYLDDVDHYVERLRHKNSGKPLFLLGHSMGGIVAALLVIERRIPVDGLILSAPALKVGDDVFPLLRRLASLVSRIWPGLRLVRLGCRRLSRDPATVEHFRTDPLVFHGRFPVRSGTEILSAGRRVLRAARAIHVPLLLLQGTADAVVDPEATRDLFAQAASPDKTLKLYDGLYHDLFGEPEKDQVIADLIHWVDFRCSQLFTDPRHA